MLYALITLLLFFGFSFNADATCFDLAYFVEGVRIGSCSEDNAKDVPVTLYLLIWLLINTAFAQLILAPRCHLVVKCVLFILALPLSPLVLGVTYLGLGINKGVETLRERNKPAIPTADTTTALPPTTASAQTSAALPQLFIGQFQFNQTEHSLCNGQHSTILEPKCLQVLSYLIEQQPRIVSLEELHSNIWQNQIVTDTAVRRVISKLRLAFDDTDTKNPKYIKSIMKRGYQLIADVKQQGTE
ncbi:winged helix-turn-helix domain-containing protein [Pseudoalteromonas sp. SR41-8]|uniref:winged helix-turn-helix domain-containing protein n=1 Tax=Pseudoalteromonas sp. SR41-8 TaxID=2760946 RepID=UPI00160457FA|nr:winged helix-turn-helix domain-containing protein [Pseudoalteromonas sp. SR41-8]MBB1307926.1 winged helix-turn-helix domain-containing protein [Pseudoalteromonas sp. SR41-8]